MTHMMLSTAKYTKLCLFWILNSFAWSATQVMKRLPFNLRPLLLVPKTQNPKAISLFLMAFLKLERLGLLDNNELIPFMIQRLIDLRSPIHSENSTSSDIPYWCWGYSFPWQTRTVLVPRGAANLVCTCFCC